MVTFIVTTTKTALSLYAKKIAERLDVNKFYSNVLQECIAPLGVPWFSWRAIQVFWRDHRFIRTLNKIGTLIHFPNQKLARYGNFLKLPYVVTVHDLIEHFAIKRDRLYCQHLSNRDKFYLNLDRRGIKKAKKIIAISQTTKNDLMNHFEIPEEQIKVIYMGVDHDIFKPTPRNICKYPYILYVGSEQPRKNFPNLLRAFSILKKEKRFEKLKLVKIGLSGEEEYRGTSLRVIQELNLAQEVLFTEFISIEDLVAYYSNAKCFILPSFYEGFGLSVLEAMACGCPVIISNRTALPEIAGGAALEVDPLDFKQLATSIREVLTNDSLERELIKKGIERASQFSWEKTAKETFKLYQEVENSLR